LAAQDAHELEAGADQEPVGQEAQEIAPLTLASMPARHGVHAAEFTEVE
jgi:hypothetical protein